MFTWAAVRGYGKEGIAESSTAMYAKVVARAWHDPAFKAWRLSDPHAALAAADETVRRGLTVKVVESTDKLVHFILPPRPAQNERSGEILEKAAGTVCSHIVNTAPPPHH